MNSDQLASLIRTILAWFFGTTVGVGILAALHLTLSDNLMTTLVGLVAGVVGLVWSMFTHKDA